MKNENDLEDLFKEKFENFEPEVNPKVWKKIKMGLKGAGLVALVAMILNKIGTKSIIAVVSSVITVASTVLVMHWMGKAPEKNNVVISKDSIVSKTIPVNEKQNDLSKVEDSPKLSEKEDSVTPPVVCKTTIATTKKESQEADLPANPNREDKEKIESVINAFSEEPIASISASTVGGPVPLIVSLANNGTGKINKWVFNDGEKSSNAVNPVHIFEEPGIYTVKLISTAVNGKTDVDSVKIEVTGNSSISSIPSVFSPNGDGKNDIFLFQSQNIVNMKAVIFDKKGNIIYTWEGIDGKWDGKNQKGKDVNAGIYFYIITAQGVDGKKFERQGSINLTR